MERTLVEIMNDTLWALFWKIPTCECVCNHGSDNEIPAELFKSLKNDAIRFCIHYVSKSGRPSSGHRTEKGQSLSQFPRRVVPKNVLTIWQLHSSPMPVRPGFSIMQTKNFQMAKLGLDKEEELEIKCQHLLDYRENKRISENIYLVTSTVLKPLTV